MNDPVTFSPEEWTEFRASFGEMKHTLNNALAVFMALSELAKRNPENFNKLVKTISDRTPQIIAKMEHVTSLLDEKHSLPPKLD